jgi:peroxiredoxin
LYITFKIKSGIMKIDVLMAISANFRSRRLYRLTVPVVVLSFLISTAMLAGAPGAPDANAQPMIGDTAPGFTLRDLDGGTHSLSDLTGEYVVLHFATTWCPFCAAEAPNLQKLYVDYRGKGVRVYIVDVKEDTAVIRKYAEKFGLTFPVLIDGDGAVAARYAPGATLPDLKRDEVVLASNLIIDREGKIRFYSLLNTLAFDAKLTHLKKALDDLIGGEKAQ